MLENFQSVNVFSPDLGEIFLNILVSLICSFIITVIYRLTYKGPGYSNNFINSIIFLSMLTAVVIMVIGNNLARAFGLVGALSIIRFRTAVKETMDIVYIFFGLVVGMAAGVGYHKMAFAGTIFVGIVLIAFSNRKFYTLKRGQYLLQFALAEGEDEKSVRTTIIENYCRHNKLINLKTNDVTKSIDYSFYISLKKKNEADALVKALKGINGINNITIFTDDEHVY